jgi:predicted transcriptional regulator
MKVKDIMEPLTNWLTPEMTILEAIRTMQHTKRGHGLAVNGIVVLDHEMKLVGILSTRDILRIVIPSCMRSPTRKRGSACVSIERKNSTQ